MAGQTLGLAHSLHVGLMAFLTLGNVTMPCVMTGGAIELGMPGQVRLHLLVYPGMAYETSLIQGAPRGDAHRGVDLTVTP
jgi:hypothetical protein